VVVPRPRGAKRTLDVPGQTRILLVQNDRGRPTRSVFANVLFHDDHSAWIPVIDRVAIHVQSDLGGEMYTLLASFKEGDKSGIG
jgi:hypothetical protein